MPVAATSAFRPIMLDSKCRFLRPLSDRFASMPDYVGKGCVGDKLLTISPYAFVCQSGDIGPACLFGAGSADFGWHGRFLLLVTCN